MKVITFKREGGRPTQQQDFAVHVEAAPPAPEVKRDPYQGFADDASTKRCVCPGSMCSFDPGQRPLPT